MLRFALEEFMRKDDRREEDSLCLFFSVLSVVAAGGSLTFSPRFYCHGGMF